MWAIEKVPSAVLLALEHLHPLGHTGKLLEGGRVWDEPPSVCTAVTGRDGLRSFLLEKMAITKETNKSVGVPKKEIKSIEESQIWRKEGCKGKTGTSIQ